MLFYIICIKLFSDQIIFNMNTRSVRKKLNSDSNHIELLRENQSNYRKYLNEGIEVHYICQHIGKLIIC